MSKGQKDTRSDHLMTCSNGRILMKKRGHRMALERRNRLLNVCIKRVNRAMRHINDLDFDGALDQIREARDSFELAVS